MIFFLALIQLVGQGDYYLESWISQTIREALRLHNIPATNSKEKQHFPPSRRRWAFIMDTTKEFIFPKMVE